MMESIENTNTAQPTISSLSSWVGPNVMQGVDQPSILREQLDVCIPDTFTWGNRMFSIGDLLDEQGGFPVGPSGTANRAFHLLQRLRVNKLFNTMVSRFVGFSWKAIKVRCTMSDPKGIVGGVHIGWVPYVDWYDKPPEEQILSILGEGVVSNNALCFVNGPNTHLMPFSTSQDITFTIPWSFSMPIFLTRWYFALNESSQSGRAPHGSPIVWMQRITANYVSGVANPARLQIYFEFEDLKFYGPTQNFEAGEVISKTKGTFKKQSGAEVAMAATLVADVGAIALDSFLSSPQPTPNLGANMVGGTYESPDAVQMAFLGDTSSIGYPTTDPIFNGLQPDSPYIVPTIKAMLQRPQFLGHFKGNGSTTTMTNKPTGFGLEVHGTYFRFFAMLSRYWRGTINFHFVILGHPMVETEFEASINYKDMDPPDEPENVFTDYAIHRSIFNGYKQIVVPLPFVSPLDYMPVADVINDSSWWTTSVSFKLTTVSTMLDVAPEIPYLLYASAGPDFGLYQPYPPGLYNVDIDDFAVARKQRKNKVPNVKKHLGTFEKQVFIPTFEGTEVASTRASLVEDPKLLPEIDTIYDYMKLWSRCVPFFAYNGGQEPTLMPEVGFYSASWYPPADWTQDSDAQNSWYFTLDYIALLSAMYVFWRGSLGHKIVAADNVTRENGYLYVSMGGNDVNRQKARSPFTYDEQQLPANANFGTGGVATPFDKQPTLDLTIAYRGSNIWSYTFPTAYQRGVAASKIPLPSSVHTNIKLENEDGVLADSMFRKADSDFSLGLEWGLPPGTMWIARGNTW